MTTRIDSLFRSVSPLLALVALGAGCIGGEEEDGADDSFLAGGKADAFGVEEGSPDAIAVLLLVNTATQDDLDNAAMLSTNTAKAIVHHRQGGDRKDGTADDDRIDTLTELDAIPYVGPMAFRLLLDRARELGVPSVDPFDENFCGTQVSAITPASLRAALPEGATGARLPTTVAGIRVRTRTCVTPDNCPPWVDGTQPNMFVLTNTGAAPTPAPVSIPAGGVDTVTSLAFGADGRPFLYFESTVKVGDATAAQPGMLGMMIYPAQVIPDDQPIVFSAQQITLDGKNMAMVGTDSGSNSLLSIHCAQAISRITDNGGATHREVTYFARY
jgi:hypothetical protein